VEVEEHKEARPAVWWRAINMERAGIITPKRWMKWRHAPSKWWMKPCTDAERSPIRMISEGSYPVDAEEVRRAEKTMIEAIREALDEELGLDERVFMVGEDVGKQRRGVRATMGMFDKYARRPGDRLAAGGAFHRRLWESARRCTVCARSARSSLPISSTLPSTRRGPKQPRCATLNGDWTCRW
jgi:hypothetical protein